MRLKAEDGHPVAVEQLEEEFECFSWGEFISTQIMVKIDNSLYSLCIYFPFRRMPKLPNLSPP